MFNSVKEFNIAMYEILIKIRNEENYRDLTKYSDLDLDDAFEKCITYGYVNGIHRYDRTASGKLSYDGKPRISLEGLTFVENFQS